MIQYFKHSEINKYRWDSCIAQSVNRLPYAQSWWLDAVSPGWEAMVQDDYRAVMPLTRKRKLNIDYLYQPYFTQQLGVFSNADLSVHDMDAFLSTIPDRYRFIDIQLNAFNNPSHRDYIFAARHNYLLNLSSPVEMLTASYHRNCRRNILKAVHAGLTVKTGPGPSVFVRFIRQNLDEKLSGIKGSFYPVLLQIVTASLQNGTGEILGVYKPGGELLAAGWFVTDAASCIFQVCASSATGKENQAMYLLVDHMIRKHAGTELIFDFAGSNIPGIAYFNQGFGANKTIYLAAKRNRLPWPLKYFKK